MLQTTKRVRRNMVHEAAIPELLLNKGTEKQQKSTQVNDLQYAPMYQTALGSTHLH